MDRGKSFDSSCKLEPTEKEVEEGDTLSDITDQINETYETSYTFDDIAQLNEIEDPDKISVGQVIIPNEVVPDVSNALRSEMNKWGEYGEKMSQIGLLERLYMFYDFSVDPNKGNLKNREGSIFYTESVENGGQGREGYVFEGDKISFDAPANILYGYVGTAAKIGAEFLYRGAGYYQRTHSKSKPEWNVAPYYGDDPSDNFYIRVGESYNLNN